MRRGPVERLRRRLLAVAERRPPDFVIGGRDAPYLRRWFLVPRNGVANAYLHQFLRSDDDRALHDHPWVNMSVLLQGRYLEQTIRAGGVHVWRERTAGDVVLRGPRAAHRIELHDGPCWTLFLTGPRLRRWGFHCPGGWRPWQEFVAPDDSGSIGPGCD